MKQKKRVDKILQAIKSRVQEEVGALLGTVFVLDTESYENISKTDCFGQLLGKQICAEMEIGGEVSGKGCLLIGIKDAIRLGGTLIMLPESELKEFVGREEYSEEIEDSYGEIANIIAGSFTKDFEEMYPKQCRFVRKKQVKLSSSKVDIESDDPVENRQLYRVSWSMSLDGTSMGELIMLFPAATFDLEVEDKVESGQEELRPEEVIAEVETPGSKVESVDPSTENPPKNEEPKLPEEKPTNISVDFEAQKKRIDRLLEVCKTKLEDEIGGLLGVPAVMTDSSNYFVSKKDFFEDRVQGKQIIANMDVVGDIEDKSFFCLNLKDAVHLGGVLIMLPPNELEITVNEEDFGEDAQDAYGEIANIVSGVYTAVFEEQYTKKLRFIKKGLTEVVPQKVEVTSDEPIPDVLYYVNSISLSVDGKQLGYAQMMFQAAMLDLHPPQHVKEDEEKQSVSEQVLEQPSVKQPVEPETTVENKEEKIDATKHKERVDKLLTACQAKMQEEVSGLLGAEVIMANIDNKIVNKEDFFFDEVSTKQVISNLDVVGELEGQSYLSVDLKDAIRIGGVLIMLPGNELDIVVAEEDFGADAEDAFGEIANIISGVYTAIFEEQYTKSIRFIRKDLQTVTPMKVDVASDDPIPDQYYYVSSMDLLIEGTTYGKVQLLFPLTLLQLEGLLAVDEPEPIETKTASKPKSVDHISADEDKSIKATADRSSLDILIIGDDVNTATTISSTFSSMGHGVKVLSFKDNIHDYIPGELKVIYLVMNDVNEQGFGFAIKISAVCTVPIVAAGPEWTRTKVIKAVKYGVRDILLTPATTEDIKENLHNNLLDLAA